jgi:hypothetical protein
MRMGGLGRIPFEIAVNGIVWMLCRLNNIIGVNFPAAQLQ